MGHRFSAYFNSDSVPFYVVRWLAIAALVGAIVGSITAFFLASLDMATDWRETHRWVIAALPLAGLAIGWVYHRYGRQVEGGNNLILEEIHDPKNYVPLRMVPLVLFGTVATHLFGGSAGREGTAVQMGGALADRITHLLKLPPEDRRTLLMMGIAAGFAAVFGTPLAGAVFGLEVLAIGRMRYDSLFPCMAAAIIANLVTLAWGIHHTHYVIPFVPALTTPNLLLTLVAGAAFGLIGMGFAKTTHVIADLSKRLITYAPLRPFVGGAVVAVAVFALGSTQFIGLGIPTIVDAFHGPLPWWDFAAKFVFTTVTLGMGFKGGEVTPLFFIGATLGNALAPVLHLPVPLLAGLGFAAVFAGASNTPIASTIMAIELFGADVGVFAAIACVTAYLFSGHNGIYAAQRIGQSKKKTNYDVEGMKLGDVRRVVRLPDINVFDDLNYLGFIPPANQKEDFSMNDVVAVRLYFPLGAKTPNRTMWQRLTASSLGHHLVSRAKAHEIEQAILHRVTAGYLKGQNPIHDHHETPSPKLPQCLELVDRVEKLHSFIEHHREALEGVKIVFMKGIVTPDEQRQDIHVAA